MALKGAALTVTLTVWDTDNNTPRTGDAANLTLRVIQDGGAPADATNSAAEKENGEYALALTADEMDAGSVTVEGSSSTDNTVVFPLHIITEQGRLDKRLGAAESAIRGADSRDLSEVYDAIPASIAGSLTVQTVDGTTSADYTDSEEIVRGGRWPAGSGWITCTLTKSGGWPDDVESWTWSLLLAPAQAGGAADLEIEADSVSLSGTTLTVKFVATPTQTATLPGTGRTKFYVELKSTDGSGLVSVYDQFEGYAWVRTRAGNT